MNPIWTLSVNFDWISFYFIIFLKIMKRVFLYGILSALLKNKLDRANIRFVKISKITKNTKKTLLFSVAT